MNLVKKIMSWDLERYRSFTFCVNNVSVALEFSWIILILLVCNRGRNTRCCLGIAPSLWQVVFARGVGRLPCVPGLGLFS